MTTTTDGVSTQGQTALSTPHPVPNPPDGDNSAACAGARARVVPETALTQGDQPSNVELLAPPPGVAALGARVRFYWRAPVVWTDAPAPLSDVAAYARAGEWTKQHGLLRGLGVGYSWLALAASTGLYYAAWVVQRPGRLATVAFTYWLAAHTPPGAWLPLPTWL